MKASRSAAILSLLALFLTAALGAAAHAQDQPNHASLQQENQRLQARVRQLEAQLAEMQTQIRQLTSQNQALAAGKQQAEAEKKELAVLAGVATPDETRARVNARVTSNYDRASNVTTVETEWSPLTVTHGSRSDHALRLMMQHAGEQPGGASVGGSSAAIRAVLFADGSGKTYNQVGSVTFTIGSGDVAVPVVNYETEMRTRGSARSRTRIDNEILTLNVPLEVARQLAAAQSAQMAVGPVKLQLDRDQTALFRALVHRLDNAGL